MQIFGDAIRFGLHSGQQDTSYEAMAGLWTRAEALGYDWVSDFDHFRPIYSDVTGPIFEGPTAMAAMAAVTERVRCGILVTGVTYRHPAVAANIAATIDHISGGRVEWGVGAAWAANEHEMLGLPFPSIGVRMDMLDEACRVMRSLWTQETTTFDGQHYQLKDARLEPKPLQERLPLVIGGSGQRRTLRIVAEHADVWNTGLTAEDDYRHLTEVLADHCADVGRDPRDVRRSVTFRGILRETEAEAADARREIPVDPRFERQLFVGTPEQCAEHLRRYQALGVGDFLLGALNPLDPVTVELVASQVAPAMR
jgi:F420-dependent oxidoreductase-like protein